MVKIAFGAKEIIVPHLEIEPILVANILDYV
jgi:hypothetical protein